MSIIEATQYELLPEGTYPAVVESVVEGITRKTREGEKPAVRIKFDTEKLGKDGKKLSAVLSANRTVGPGSSLAKYAKQITGRVPVPGQFDPQSLVGMKVTIEIEHHENNGRVYANVVHISKRSARSGTNGGTKAAAGTGGIAKTNVHGVDITDADVEFPGDVAGA